MVRKEIFDQNYPYDGSFQENCQQVAVPPSLLALVGMITEGASIKHQTGLCHSATKKPALAISQLLVYNSVKHARKLDLSSSACHLQSQETPLPIYVSLEIHGVTQSRGPIQFWNVH